MIKGRDYLIKYLAELGAHDDHCPYLAFNAFESAT
jgi:hypothetical protein